MSDQSLQPFSFPAALPFSISPGALVVWALYAIFVFWAIYTIMAIYHWLKYSHASWVAFPAIVAHLLVSLLLMTYALSGTLFI